jgi:DNA ligase-1
MVLEYLNPPSSRRRGIMLAYPFEEKRLLKWPQPLIIQPKLNGERCRAILDPSGHCSLLSSEENLITSVPHIVIALENLHLKNVELDGELYVHSMPFEEIHSRVSRKVNEHPESWQIEYHIFDLINEKRQTERIVELHKLAESFTPPLIEVAPQVALNLENIMMFHDQFLEQGYEGFILRHPHAPYVRTRSTNLMKFKPKKEDYYRIVSYVEEMSIHKEPKNSLGALTLQSDLRVFNVGTGFTADQRHDLWKIRDSLIGKVARIQYQHLTSNHIPRFPVFVEILSPELGDLGG